jgi:hypothetical protein
MNNLTKWLMTFTVFGLVILPTIAEDANAQRCRGTQCRGQGGSTRGDRGQGSSTRGDRGQARRPRTDYRRSQPVRNVGHIPHSRWNSNRQNNRHNSYRHRPNWNRRNYVYRRHNHINHTGYRNHQRRYSSPRQYHYSVPYQFIYWNTWLRYRVTWNDGFYWNNYPFFVYNGYRHRYSHMDTCNYELVDGYTNNVQRSYPGYSCNTGYDLCANLRDSLNWQSTGYRYFCSEKFSYDSSHSYNWNYNTDFYSDLGDTSSNNDDYNYNNNYYN